MRVIRLTWNPLRVIFHVACLTGALAMPAQADLLIPLLFTTPLLLIGALIPTIVVEGLIILARLDIGLLLSVAVSAANNVVSALIGVPLAFMLAGFMVDKVDAAISREPSKLMRYFVAPIILGSGIWYDGIEPVRNKWIGWGAQLLMIVFFVPFFFVSWWVEAFVAGWILPGLPSDRISGTVMLANLASYALLVLFILNTGLQEYRESRKELAGLGQEDDYSDGPASE